MITILGGTFENCFLNNYGICELLNPANINFGGKLMNHAGATINVHGSGGLIGADDFENFGTLNWQRPLTPPLNAATDPRAGVRMIAAQQVSNSGLITGNASCLLTSDGAGILVNGGGSVISNDGGSLVSHDGGGLIGDDGSGLLSEGGLGLLSERGNGLLSSDGAGLVSDNGLGFHGAQSSSKNATAPIAADSTAGFIQTGGEIDISHTIILGPATINGGSVTGSRHHRR